ncbi:hypothetical protein [Pseudomonas putida]|uniref:hypothetical protein n=1 Tax=Pseudomonas putida TaxID=303 RepID=UPI000FD940DB|nr:hypothetical protein [Pseudomonas putida]MDD2018895.1 hypothetical protein [Pseudomonas putida]
MPTVTTSRLPTPTSWDEFEDICKTSFGLRWSNPNLSRHGRQGQQQDGVDIYGRDSHELFVGVQCKNTTRTITEQLITSECSKAEKFRPTIQALYIATTAERDVHIQAFARELSNERVAEEKFPVEVVFWADVISDLAKDDTAVRQHFPQFFNQNTVTQADLIRSKDVSNLMAVLQVLDLTSIADHFHYGAKYIHCSVLEQYNQLVDVQNRATFKIHDQALSAALKKMTGEWQQLYALIHSAPYDLIPQRNELSFIMPLDFCRNKEENDLYEEIDQQIKGFLIAVGIFCRFVNETYHEVNLDETSMIARRLYN